MCRFFSVVNFVTQSDSLPAVNYSRQQFNRLQFYDFERCSQHYCSRLIAQNYTLDGKCSLTRSK